MPNFGTVKKRYAMAGPVHYWDKKRKFQIKFLKGQGLMPHHCLLDIGCGPLRGGIPIIDFLYTGHYFGIEVRYEVLTEALRELEDKDLTQKAPNFIVTKDLSQFCIDQKFDFIWAFSTLIHMTDDVLENTLVFVNNHLADDGVFYANVNSGTRSLKNDWQGFPVVFKGINDYKSMCLLNGLVAEDIGNLADFGHSNEGYMSDKQRILKIVKKRGV